MTETAAAARASRRRASRVDATLVLGLVMLGLIALISVLGPLLSDPALANVGAVRPRRPPVHPARPGAPRNRACRQSR